MRIVLYGKHNTHFIAGYKWFGSKNSIWQIWPENQCECFKTHSLVSKKLSKFNYKQSNTELRSFFWDQTMNVGAFTLIVWSYLPIWIFKSADLIFKSESLVASRKNLLVVLKCLMFLVTSPTIVRAIFGLLKKKKELERL